MSPREERERVREREREKERRREEQTARGDRSRRERCPSREEGSCGSGARGRTPPAIRRLRPFCKGDAIQRRTHNLQKRISPPSPFSIDTRISPARVSSRWHRKRSRESRTKFDAEWETTGAKSTGKTRGRRIGRVARDAAGVFA